MSKEGGEVEVLEQRRKSARILALEEEKEKQKRNSCAIANNTNNNLSNNKGKSTFSENIGSFLMPPPPPPLLPSLKRGRKQRRLEDLAQSQSQQDIANHAIGNSSSRNDQPNGVSSIQSVPEKRILECVLNILQRRDKYKIFAQPVNPKEVESYYTIIKEPMDFGTMRTKLHEGKYTSFEQFERDVFLIFSNAMHFNSSTTIYYKEARRMQALGQMVFAALRVDPNKVESLFSPTRGRPPAKRLPTISEIKGPRTKLRRPGGLKIGASQLGSRDGGNSTLLKGGRPPIYRPWASFASENESLFSSVYNAPNKVLIEKDTEGDYGYKESLLRFVKGLGQTAYKVAARKLLKCLPQPPTVPPQSPLIIHPQQTPQKQVLLPNSPSPSFQHKTNLASSSYDLLCNFPGSSNFVHNQKNKFLDFLNIQSLTQVNPLRNPSSGIQIRDQPKTNDNILKFSSIQPISSSHDLLGKMPTLDNLMTSTPSFNVFGSSSTRNMTYPSDQNMSTSIRQNVGQHQQQKTNSKFWLASHLKVIPVYDPMNGRTFRTVDMIAEAKRKGKQQVVDHSDHEVFRNWKSTVKGKQPVADHVDHNEVSNTNWQSRRKDFLSLSPTDRQTTRFQPASGFAHASGTSTSTGNWQYLMNSNSVANLTHETDQFLEGIGNGISSLHMLVTNDHYQQDHINSVPFRYAASNSYSTQLGILPMPLYNETYSCIVHDRAGASGSPDHHYQRPDSARELLGLKDQQPDLALQL